MSSSNFYIFLLLSFYHHCLLWSEFPLYGYQTMQFFANFVISMKAWMHYFLEAVLQSNVASCFERWNITAALICFVLHPLPQHKTVSNQYKYQKRLQDARVHLNEATSFILRSSVKPPCIGLRLISYLFDSHPTRKHPLCDNSFQYVCG